MDPHRTLATTAILLVTAIGLAAVPAAAQDPAFDSGNLASGDTFSWTPGEPGTYGYHCTYHGSMTGTVTVTDGQAGDDVEVRIEGFAFHPANVTVTTGTTITWTNLDDTGHTVTADEDAGSVDADDGGTVDDGTTDSPGPGVLGSAVGLVIASLVVAGRRS